MEKDSNIRYKGYRSPTLHLVLLGFVTGTALLICGLIDQQIWETSVLGMLTAYIIASGISKSAEAYTTSHGGTTGTPS